MATEMTETKMANNGERNWPGLCELTDSLPEVDAGLAFFPIKGEMPKVVAIAEALVRAAMRIELRLACVADEIDRLDADFDFMPDDYLAMQRVAAVELDEARELLEGMKTAMLRWFRCINASAIVELDSEAWAAVKTLRSRSPAHILVGHLVEVAVLHLAADKASDAIVAAHERARLEALDREYGDKAGVRKRTAWPWTNQNARPWDDAGHSGNREQADAGRKPEDEPEDESVDTPDEDPGVHSAVEEELGAEPLYLQLADYDLSNTHEEVTIAALPSDLPAIRRDVLEVARRYNLRHEAAVSVAVERLREAGDNKANVEKSGSAAQGNVQPTGFASEVNV